MNSMAFRKYFHIFNNSTLAGAKKSSCKQLLFLRYTANTLMDLDSENNGWVDVEAR